MPFLYCTREIKLRWGDSWLAFNPWSLGSHVASCPALSMTCHNVISSRIFLPKCSCIVPKKPPLQTHTKLTEDIKTHGETLKTGGNDDQACEEQLLALHLHSTNPRTMPGAPLRVKLHCVCRRLCESVCFCSPDLKEVCARFCGVWAKYLILRSYKTKEICREWHETDAWMPICILFLDVFYFILLFLSPLWIN